MISIYFIDDGTRLYAGILTVYEELYDPKKDLNIEIDEEEVAQIFIPRSLVLISSYPYFESFKTILLSIYKTINNNS